MTDPSAPSSYYRALPGGRYQPTPHAQGAWSEHEQHMAPVSGLLAHALERHEPREDLQIARITYDILGVIQAAETKVTTRTLRPGRTIELVQAVATVADRDVVRATAWRLARQDTREVAGVEAQPLPDPQSTPPWEGMGVWGGGYISSVEFRAIPGGRPGAGRAWLRTLHRLVDTEDSTDLARFVGLVDTANGIGPRHSPEQWMFPNTDLSIHFFRTPRMPWVGLTGEVSWGPTGLGVTATVLHDQHGPVGHATQALTVRPRT